MWLWASNLLNATPGTGSEPIFFAVNNLQEPEEIDTYLFDSEPPQYILELKAAISQAAIKVKDFKGKGRLPDVKPEPELREVLLSNLEEENSEIADTLINIYYLRSQMTLKPPTLPDSYYQRLSELGVTHQIFATPEDHKFDSYGSDQPDIDHYFGSLGSILKNREALQFVEEGGTFEVNILHYGPLHPLIIRQLIQITNRIDAVFYIVHDIAANPYEYDDDPSYFWSRPFSVQVETDGRTRNTKRLLVLRSPKMRSSSRASVEGGKSTRLPTEVQLQQLYSSLEDKKTRPWKTLPILTRFEKAYTIGLRSKHLGLGAPPTIEVPKGVLHPNIVAEMELDAGTMPISIHRPDGERNINELVDYSRHGHLY